ncbi:MAG: DsbA family protein [Chromatiales bacterium]|nr:DsbA family protein [Chromatiales bacterium]
MSNLFRHLPLLMLLACALPLASVRAADTAARHRSRRARTTCGCRRRCRPAVPDKAEVIEFFVYLPTLLRPGAGGARMAETQAGKCDVHADSGRLRCDLGVHGARAYYAAEALGVLDKVHQPLFDAIHREKRKLSSEDELAALFAEHGVDQDAFRKAYKSLPDRNPDCAAATSWSQRYGVRGYRR